MRTAVKLLVALVAVALVYKLVVADSSTAAPPAADAAEVESVEAA
ncbi:MAG: hypothetical protein ABEJ42_09920 [Halobacteriaceae archaeon]